MVSLLSSLRAHRALALPAGRRRRDLFAASRSHYRKTACRLNPSLPYPPARYLC
ncbi:MAG: hypothetical protein MZU84_08220 [Sphingobacterium sp.]|nr:hypothetical protein [Sphingobacterium sp.]